ncbi:unnamed protein product [Arabis nemorensis]|uniref:SURP motif domain-containing protein n=1 Tax=Arabis nemorensis TaxID=586526 RepID=A0A565CMN4_9BRAS|nr:unnamed protein product [Arabis nemorensis]
MHPGFLVLLPLGPPDYNHSRFLPQPPPLYLRNLFVNTLPPRITLKELAIIKLTAQFAIRYGMPFVLDLMSRVYMEPEFEFLKHTDSFYDGVRDLYRKFLKPSEKVEKSDGCSLVGRSLWSYFSTVFSRRS